VSRDSDALLMEASLWLARLERGLQAREGALLRQWLNEPARRNAIVDTAKLYHGPDIVAVLAEMVPVGFGDAPPPKAKPLRPSIASWCFGAALLLFMIGPILLAPRPTQHTLRTTPHPVGRPAPWGDEVYATDATQIRTVRLPDGSHVTLKGYTKLRMLYGPATRAINLQYGATTFQVAGEPYRPFEIEAAGRQFRAMPSKFDVRVINPRVVELTVLDGGVTVLGLPWHSPTTAAEARNFDPRVFADLTVGPMQTALLDEATLSVHPIGPARTGH
jgi:transmembrane sensor